MRKSRGVRKTLFSFNIAQLLAGRLKMREWKMRYGQKCKGGKYRSGKYRSGKCRSRLAVWKAEPRLYSETALSYFLKIVLRLLTK